MPGSLGATVRVRHPGLVVAVAILLSLPMAPGIVDGSIPAASALLRFLVALLLVWGGTAVVATLLQRYAEQNRRAQLARMIEDARQRTADQARGAAGRGPGAPPAPGAPPGSPPPPAGR